MISFRIDSNPEAVNELLVQLVRELKHMEPVMGSIGTELEAQISGRFETETDPDGEAWAQWSPMTEATYPDDGNRRILDRYGDMLRSLNHKATERTVRVGFGAVASKAKDVYAVYHEFGTDIMPRRGLLFSDPNEGTLGEGDEAAIVAILEDWLNGIIR